MGSRKPKGRRRAGEPCDEDGGAKATPGRAEGGKRYSPEERRQAVEAYQKAGLTQKAFAAQWGISAVTLGSWVRKHGEEGPQGLERMAAGPVKRRGRPPLAAPVREEVVSVQRRFPDFGLKKVRHFLARFSGVRVSVASVRRIRKAEGLPAESIPAKRKRKPAPPRRFERATPGDLWQTDITYLNVPWSRGPLYLIAYLDDHSRYVVGHGLFTHQRADIAIDVFLDACRRFGNALALRVSERPPAEAPARGRPPRDVIENVLKASGVPLPYAVLRETCGMRNSTLWTCLKELLTERRVEKSPRGYAPAAT